MLPGKIFSMFLIEPYGGKLIFYCNVDPKQVKTWKHVPPFYKDVLIFYYELIKPDLVDVISQCIWNNCKVIVGKKPCRFNNMLFIEGMKLISDLYDEDGNIIPFNSWVNRGIPQQYFLQGRSIGAAIPTSWKNVLKQGFKREHCSASGFTILGEDIDFDNMTTKMIYQILIHRFQEPPTSQSKYEEE